MDHVKSLATYLSVDLNALHFGPAGGDSRQDELFDKAPL